jgi:hypothetical protein
LLAFASFFSAHLHITREYAREENRKNRKNGRLLPGRPFRRPHLRVRDRKRHFYRRGVAVFVLPFTVRFIPFLSLKADEM